MKRYISDLLDGCCDSAIELNTNTPLSSQRIKELTMKKVKNTHKVRRFGTRLLIAAALVSMLAVTAFAAGGGAEWFRNFFAGNGEELTPEEIDFIESNAKDETQGKTEGCYHVALDSFLSDGGMTHVKIAVQAVDGAEIADAYYTFRRMDVVNAEGENISAGITWAEENVEAENNTAFYLLSFDSLSIQSGADGKQTVTLKLQDLCMDGEIVAEGDWKFDFELPDVSLELVSEPMTGFVLWDEDGNEMDVTVVSVVFRPLGVTVKYEQPAYGGQIIPGTAKSVMKDGTVKELLPGAWGRDSDEADALHWVEYYGGLIVPEEVDYIELPGGIQLSVTTE